MKNFLIRLAVWSAAAFVLSVIAQHFGFHSDLLIAGGLPLGAGGAISDTMLKGLATWDGGGWSTLAAPGGNITLTAAQFVAGSNTFLTVTGAVAAFNATTPSAQQMVQQFKQAYGAAPTVGSTFVFELINQNTNTITLVAGTGVTITGTATVATTVTRSWIVTFTGVGDSNGLGATVTLQNLSSRNAT